MNRFSLITSLPPNRRRYDTAAADLDGTLLTTNSSFKYFVCLSREAGSRFRTGLLYLVAPAVYITYKFLSESAGIKILIYISLAGLKEEKVRQVAERVLTSMYAAHVRRDSWELFTEGMGRREVVTANPTVMVRDFAQRYLGAGCLGTRLVVNDKTGKYTGRVEGCVLVGPRKKEAVEQAFGTDQKPDLGLGDRETDHDFMALCQDAYMVPANKKAPRVSEAEQLARVEAAAQQSN
ncbi:putative glycerol-3-phosphate acyltransferase 8 [Carex littledalei]|uniref:Putative glycerol-3-phosphate acyltransferase 8 n=1 Tax=Carex littledalei TaxID=544730 RepID=A0A833VTU5_9POAL|nr:putative glycerol-3-phosphate acyltransferase 8 [Carex littledalei]